MPRDKKTIQLPDVLRAVQDDQARTYLMTHYKRAGLSLDELGRGRAAREAMLEALIATEDWLELQQVDTPLIKRNRLADLQEQRDSIRPVRRALEQELWP